MAQIAAFNVGFQLPAARLIGQLAGELAGRLLGAEPDGPGMRALQYADVTFSAAGKLAEYLDVGRVEVRSADDAAQRLRDLDRDPQPSRSRTTDEVSRVDVLPAQQALRSDREPLRGVDRSGRHRSASRDLSGPGDLPGPG